MAKENIEKEAKLEEIKKDLEEVKKKIATQQTEEEVPVIERIANFEMFSESNKLDVIYGEMLNLKANMNYIREKVLELQSSIGKPA
jgi:uncharacterized protein YlaN (UPF0358 family)